MVGKATIFVVAGFSLIFLIVEYNMGNVSTRAVSNFTDYYIANYSREIAISGANLAANQIFLDPTWSAGFNDVKFQENNNEGTLNVEVVIINAFQNHKKIISVGEFLGVRDTVEVILIPSKFSKFAYYSQVEGSIWWMDKDTVLGPFHTQDQLRINGHPTFFSKVSSKNGSLLADASSSANFYGGYDNGVDLTLPTDGLSPLEAAATSDGQIINGQDTVYITFVSDSIRVKFAYGGPETSYFAQSFAPNGVIAVKEATVRLKGTVKGQFTVAAPSTTTNRGNIYIDDDIVYNTDPRTNPSSTDMLGIIAQNNVYVTDNPANNNNNSINIDGSIYAEDGGFGAENHDSRSVSGAINLFGGIIQNTRKAVGTFSGSSITAGFSKNYKYDDRLLLSFPPSFPGTGGYEIVSWYE